MVSMLLHQLVLHSVQNKNLIYFSKKKKNKKLALKSL